MNGIAKHAAVAAMLAAFSYPVLAQDPANVQDQGPVVVQGTDIAPEFRIEALGLVNDARAEAGLPELVSSEVLDRAAQGHAADMLDRDYYDHVTPEGETPFERYLAADGNPWAVSGENIATCEGCPTPPDVEQLRSFHEGWMQSPGHRENILSEGFDSFGFGIVGEGDEIYAVQTFSGPGTDEADELADEAARDVALEEVNAIRAEAGYDPLTESEALDTVAQRILESLTTEPEALPKDVFGLLPEGSTGWTSLDIQSASLGGTGTALSRKDVVVIVSDWAAASEGDKSLGSPASSHFGFAAESAGDGRTTAVAIFGGQE
ncbi:MAG: CAP domain-containing protein [Rhodobacterales bacterium]